LGLSGIFDPFLPPANLVVLEEATEGEGTSTRSFSISKSTSSADGVTGVEVGITGVAATAIAIVVGIVAVTDEVTDTIVLREVRGVGGERILTNLSEVSKLG
jgi:hypothetical protein